MVKIKDLNINQQFELELVNGQPTTDYSVLSMEEVYLKRLIERTEIHFRKNEIYDEVFSFENFHGKNDEEIEEFVTERLYDYYSEKVANIREVMLIEVFKSKNNLLVFYKYIKTNTYLTGNEEKPYKIYF